MAECDVLKFRDRDDAGLALAGSIEKSLASDQTDAVVIGIPRGGVVLADIVAGKLDADFDIVIPRKLGAPGNGELAVGAVMQDGTAYINEYLVRALRISADYIGSEKQHQAAEINRRSALYRNPAIPYRISGKTVFLVDDGVATGATIMASAEWIKKQGPSRLVVAVPVAPIQSVSLLESAADSVVVLTTPRDFGSVGQFYEDFAAVSDEQVMAVMKSRKLL